MPYTCENVRTQMTHRRHLWNGFQRNTTKAKLSWSFDQDKCDGGKQQWYIATAYSQTYSPQSWLLQCKQLQNVASSSNSDTLFVNGPPEPLGQPPTSVLFSSLLKKMQKYPSRYTWNAFVLQRSAPLPHTYSLRCELGFIHGGHTDDSSPTHSLALNQAASRRLTDSSILGYYQSNCIHTVLVGWCWVPDSDTQLIQINLIVTMILLYLNLLYT